MGEHASYIQDLGKVFYLEHKLESLFVDSFNWVGYLEVETEDGIERIGLGDKFRNPDDRAPLRYHDGERINFIPIVEIGHELTSTLFVNIKTGEVIYSKIPLAIKEYFSLAKYDWNIKGIEKKF